MVKLENTAKRYIYSLRPAFNGTHDFASHSLQLIQDVIDFLMHNAGFTRLVNPPFANKKYWMKVSIHDA
jgi:hypothetical protein